MFSPSPSLFLSTVVVVVVSHNLTNRTKALLSSSFIHDDDDDDGGGGGGSTYSLSYLVFLLSSQPNLTHKIDDKMIQEK